MSISESTPSYSPNKSSKENENEENQWGNKFQFILSCIGLSVGLGNVWRFPGLAYENGGSAFLIPYITCGFVFSLPAIYMEFIIGQYTQANPAKAFYMYAPAFHGVGLTSTVTCISVGVFYAAVIGWIMLYLGLTIGGQSYKWTRCDNYWNTDNCIPSEENTACYNTNSTLPYAFNGTCVSEPRNGTMNGAEEFFRNYVTPRSSGIEEFGSFNYPVALCIFILYVLCAATNIKGIKILGKISYFTVPLPYIVVLILFIRGMFLDGAIDGVNLYLFKPDMSKLLNFQTWVAALNQTCFSLTLGLGALISLASHNKKKNNCFRDALTVILFDTLMSVLGGLAVFSILGYLAKQTGKEITKIVENAIIELGCGYLNTTFSSLKKKWIAPILISVVLCLCAMCIATEAGWYWFNLMADCAAQASIFAAITFQFVLFYVYGWGNLFRDLENIFGPKPKNFLRFVFSRHSPYFFFCWAVVCPILAMVGFVLILDRKFPTLGNYVYPTWAEVIGWFLNLGPILAIPICLAIECCRLMSKGKSLTNLFRPAKEHPSHDRILRRKKISSSEGVSGREESSTEAQETHSV